MSSNTADLRPRSGHAAGQSTGTVVARAGAAAIALLAGGAGLFIAANHPLLPALALGGVAVAAGLACRYRLLWLLVLPAVLPVLSFAPWTGWLSFEEIDLLVLAVAAGGYARLAMSPAARDKGRGVNGLVRLGVTALVACTLASMWRGFADAGGFVFGWFEGYHESMNSLRIAKGPLFAVLLWPLWLDAQRSAPAVAAARLRNGLALGLAAASLAAVWERAAFTNLLDFSSDYRTTALFWEMHVGGAAFDGFLALTLPFALLAALGANRLRRGVPAAVVVALGAYACLTTFSRGVYLAVPAGVALFAVLRISADRSAPAPGRRAEQAFGAALVVAFLVAAAWVFPTSGYRGGLALLGGFGGLLALANLPAGPGAWPRASGVGLGLVLGAAGLAVGPALPKGAYGVFAAAVLLGLASFGGLQRRAGSAGTHLAATGLLAAALWASVALVQVSGHWGGDAAFWRALPVAAGLAVAMLGVALFRAPWPARPRWQAGVFGSMVVAFAVVAVFTGGAYMTERFSTSSGDFALRLQHWREGVALLRTPGDWLLGRGLGRYPAADYLTRLGEEHPGDYRLRADGDTARLVLAAGKQVLGFGEVLRMSQRVSPPGDAPHVRFSVRTAQPLGLLVEVCEKHLLYTTRCQAQDWTVTAGGPGWQPVDLQLAGPPVTRGAFWAPRQLVFSIGLATPGATAEIGALQLIGPGGADLLENGDFRRGLAHWFFSSDRYHLPWHIKNMALNVLLDQGLAGAVLVTALLVGGLWRTTVGAAAQHPLAPAIAAALCGFVIVGLFDSLLDVPRVGLLFYLLTFIALSLPAGPRAARRA